MPQSIVLVLWAFLTIALLRFDPGRRSRVSSGLWVPVIWLVILGSRSVSQWLFGSVVINASSIEDGNPVDRNISILLMLIAIAILASRSFPWGRLVAKNQFLFAFLLFALISVLWSDFPGITLKRWFRDVGSYLILLVPLSEDDPVEAVGTVFRRSAIILIPLSIVLDKYFPNLSKQYDPWTGVGSYVGVTTSKNMLGLLCLVSGLYFFWDCMRSWPLHRQKRVRQTLLFNAFMLALTLWVLHTSQSTTSEVCLMLGCLTVFGLKSKRLQSKQRLIRRLVPLLFITYLVLDFGLGMNGKMAESVGKNPNLTDRTLIWAFLLGMHTNPILGVGYESFWLGPRLQWFWQNAGLGHINEAHNGYLEVYLELGLTGCTLLAGFLLARYRALCKALEQGSELAVLGLATWLVLVFYNMSEAAFDGGLLYSLFLVGAMTVPGPAMRRISQAAAVQDKTERRSTGSAAIQPVSSFRHHPLHKADKRAVSR